MNENKKPDRTNIMIDHTVYDDCSDQSWCAICAGMCDVDSKRTCLSKINSKGNTKDLCKTCQYRWDNRL